MCGCVPLVLLYRPVVRMACFRTFYTGKGAILAMLMPVHPAFFAAQAANFFAQ
jgi:hypothetical protein